ncbi:MAG: tetratricopeptide repeat protein [bacterium]
MQGRYFSLVLLVVVVLAGCDKPTEEALFKEAEDANRSEQYDAALEKYGQFCELYPASKKYPEALFQMGNILYEQKSSFREAIKSFQRILKEYPQHPIAPTAAYLIGYIAHRELKDLNAATIAYEDFLNRFPAALQRESARAALKELKGSGK